MTGSPTSTGALLDHLAAMFAADVDRSGGDRVSIAAHMLQSAAAADAASADRSLVVASLLHDIGHWLAGEHAGALDVSDDENHGTLAAAYLAPHFGPEVTRPIALHVAAKRYLCAREHDYFASLSPGSVRSLERQGGPMSAPQVERFEATPGHEAALALRRWDEYAKIPALEVPGFAHYRSLLETLARNRPGA